jgi:5-formyltetrahydrofolate cyclo-ligase
LSLPSEKAELRVRALAQRERAHAVFGADAALALASLPWPAKLEMHSKTVSGFHPYQSEIDVRLLLGRLSGDGWTTCLPVVIGKGMPLEFRRWFAGEPLVAGLWGILRPSNDAEIVEPDVLLVPMLAFDLQGYRLGYGGGFYDRTLEKLRERKKVVAIGVAYAAQEIDAVPYDGHDQRLDFVMTEKGVFACG